MNDYVLIVDDEPIIRKGLKSFIDWKKEGLSLEGDCANGLEALEMLRSRHIDILITDIKMPLMDGLQLTRHALEINPGMKIILISSYNEFEYVREGMKYGAIDYLLKPSLEAEELISVLNRCKEMLQNNRKQAVVKLQYDQHAFILERKRFEQEIIRLLVSNQVDFSFVDIFGIQDSSYVCAFVVSDGMNEWRELFGNLHISIMYEDMQAVFYEEFQKGSAQILTGEGLFLIYPDEEGAELSILRFKTRIEEELGMPITIGYCVEEENEGLEKGLRKSRSASMRRFFDGTGKVFNWEERVNSVNEVEPLELNMNSMLEMIRAVENNISVIESCTSRWMKRGLSPEQVKREAYEILSAFAYLNGDSKSLSDFRENVWRCDTINQLESTLRTLIEEMEHPNRFRLNDKGHSGQLILKAIKYIKLHYREELTLHDVAESIHVSKSYFSNLFKKQLGQNFIDYLIDLRLHEAKRLLVHNECKVYEVAEKSGFNDVKYFSKLFKKITQMTPVEYREKHQ